MSNLEIYVEKQGMLEAANEFEKARDDIDYINNDLERYRKTLMNAGEGEAVQTIIEKMYMCIKNDKKFLMH